MIIWNGEVEVVERENVGGLGHPMVIIDPWGSWTHVGERERERRYVFPYCPFSAKYCGNDKRD